jgi:hypothetical protein
MDEFAANTATHMNRVIRRVERYMHRQGKRLLQQAGDEHATETITYFRAQVLDPDTISDNDTEDDEGNDGNDDDDVEVVDSDEDEFVEDQGMDDFIVEEDDEEMDEADDEDDKEMDDDEGDDNEN